MTARTETPAEREAVARTEAYGKAVLLAARQLTDAGAVPAEVAAGTLNAAVVMLEDLSSRDQVRRMLVELADSLIDHRAN